MQSVSAEDVKIYLKVESRTNIENAVYFSVIRKDGDCKKMTADELYEQDKSFLSHISVHGFDLSKFPFIMELFPYDIRKVGSQLCIQKPIDKDLNGLLSLIMFAGVESEYSESFRSHTIARGIGKDNFKLLCECQQNLSVFLLCVTLDDVSRTCC